jgi:SAM-dependent methyltransferase
MDSPATANQQGWSSHVLNEVSEEFVEACRGARQPVLDIGAAFGVATLAALETGATVVANDLEALHLEKLRESATEEQRRRLVLVTGRFPRHLHFAENSFDLIHASNVFHFLTGPQLQSGATSIAHWLAPGGRFFLQAATPWLGPFVRFGEAYAERLQRGDEWPGWVEHTRDWSEHGKLGQLPASLHLLEPELLQRVFAPTGLVVERCWLYRRRDLPKSLMADGRESVGLVVRKP